MVLIYRLIKPSLSSVTICGEKTLNRKETLRNSAKGAEKAKGKQALPTFEFFSRARALMNSLPYRVRNNSVAFSGCCSSYWCLRKKQKA